MHHTATRFTLALVAVASLTAACERGTDHSTLEAKTGSVTASTQTPETTAPTATSIAEPATTVAAATQNTTATTIKRKPAATTTSSTAPNPKPAQAVSEAAPTAKPVMLTLTGPTSMTCAALTFAGGKVTVSWTTGHATAVSLSVNSSRGTRGLAPDGSRQVTLQCDTTNTITATPSNSGGAGEAKQIIVKIGT